MFIGAGFIFALVAALYAVLVFMGGSAELIGYITLTFCHRFVCNVGIRSLASA